ncbi:MAG: Grx4 family monothiol glutaredoxin [Polyangiaceae bacterium]|nr:Grx4 family monothiol glutaredoxin [Polyangiaceae bacterium]
MTDPIHDKIASLVKSHDVVLFMKGSKHFPQCGFSSTVVGILNEFLPKYETVNVLADPAIRDGIKSFSNWPTIPQLYVRGEFIGGCDIIKEMHASGELETTLGVPKKAAKPPTINVTDAAAKAFKDAAEIPTEFPRIEIDAEFATDLYFEEKKADDVSVIANGITFLLDPKSAKRANGMTIDYVEKPAAGFRIENPNAPPRVRPLRANELKAWVDEKTEFHLFDVRTPEERAIATIASAIHLDEAGATKLMSLPKDAKIVFHCHHGMRSRQAGERAIQEGYTHVYNLEGGIAAWSRDVDSSVPTY